MVSLVFFLQVGVGSYPLLRVQRSPDVYNQDQISCKLEEPQYSDAETSDILSRSNSGYRPVKVAYLDFGNSNASPDIIRGAPNYTESELFYGWHEIEKQSSADLEELCREVKCLDKEHCRHGENTSNFSYFQNNARFPVHVNEDEQGFTPSSLKEDEEVKEEIPSKEGQQPISETVLKGEESLSATPAKEMDDHSSTETPANAASSLRKNSLTRDQARLEFLNRSLQLVRSLSCNSSLISDSASPWFKITDYTPEKECERCKRKLCELNSGSSSERGQSHPKNGLDTVGATPAGETLSGNDCAADSKEKDLPTAEKETTKTSVSSV